MELQEFVRKYNANPGFDWMGVNNDAFEVFRDSRMAASTTTTPTAPYQQQQQKLQRQVATR